MLAGALTETGNLINGEPIAAMMAAALKDARK
jgi:hypothetical protein